MNLQKRFTEQQLETIIDEATIYMCACPAQVAEQIRHLRQMIRYQNNCAIQEDTDTVVHKSIAKAGLQAGDKVIVQGLQKVRPGMPVKPVETGSKPAADGQAKPAAAAPAAR